MADPHNPHDAVFRRFLSRPADAASELRAVLPEPVAARVRWNQLTQVPDSFVDEDLRWRHSDLLFRAPLEDGPEVLLYLLVEHQSRPDPLMPYRILRYVVRLWDKHLSSHPAAKQLPIVFPLVVHHGDHPWTTSTQLRELINAPDDVLDSLSDYLPNFRFELDDLTRSDLDALRARALTPAVLVTFVLLQTAPGNPDIATELLELATELHQVQGSYGTTDIVAFLNYIRYVGESSPAAVHQSAQQLGPTISEAYMTTYEQIINQGRAEGRAEALIEFLTVKFGAIGPEHRTLIEQATPETLTTWTARIFDTDTIDDVLA